MTDEAGTSGDDRRSDGDERDERFSDKALKNVAGVSPSKRYLRLDEILSQYNHKLQMSYKAFDTKNGIEVAWHIINLETLHEVERKQVTDIVTEFKEKKFESRFFIHTSLLSIIFSSLGLSLKFLIGGLKRRHRTPNQ